MKNEGKIIHFLQRPDFQAPDEKRIPEIDLTPAEVLSYFTGLNNTYRETPELIIHSLHD